MDLSRLAIYVLRGIMQRIQHVLMARLLYMRSEAVFVGPSSAAKQSSNLATKRCNHLMWPYSAYAAVPCDSVDA